jgi:hypothetical protein
VKNPQKEQHPEEGSVASPKSTPYLLNTEIELSDLLIAHRLSNWQVCIEGMGVHVEGYHEEESLYQHTGQSID